MAARHGCNQHATAACTLWHRFPFQVHQSCVGCVSAATWLSALVLAMRLQVLPSKHMHGPSTVRAARRVAHRQLCDSKSAGAHAMYTSRSLFAVCAARHHSFPVGFFLFLGWPVLYISCCNCWQLIPERLDLMQPLTWLLNVYSEMSTPCCTAAARSVRSSRALQSGFLWKGSAGND